MGKLMGNLFNLGCSSEIHIYKRLELIFMQLFTRYCRQHFLAAQVPFIGRERYPAKCFDAWGALYLSRCVEEPFT